MESNKKRLTQERLKELLDYDPMTGEFVRKVTTGRHGCHKKGELAGCYVPGGYVLIRVDGTLYKAHRLAVFYTDGVWPVGQVDHKDQIKHNNARQNIRCATNQLNSRNIGNQKNNTSGVKGVCWHKQRRKWSASIRVGYKKRSLGLYSDFPSAVCARLAGEQCLDWHNCETESPAYQYVQKMLGQK